MAWYVVHTYSGYENKAKLALEERIKSAKKETFFGEIIVPEENVVELVKGQKKTTKRRFFPGYILVQDGPDRRDLAHREEHPENHGFRRR